jgi:hypothetical protein
MEREGVRVEHLVLRRTKNSGILAFANFLLKMRGCLPFSIVLYAEPFSRRMDELRFFTS